jgi:hypothetical protein
MDIATAKRLQTAFESDFYAEVAKLHRQGKPTGTAALLANLNAMDAFGIDWERLKGNDAAFREELIKQPKLSRYMEQKVGWNMQGHGTTNGMHQLKQEQILIRAVSVLGKNPSVFRMSADFVRQMLATEHEKAVVTNLRLPLPALILELEPCIELLNLSTGLHPLQCVALHELEFAEGERIVNWVAQCGPKAGSDNPLDDNYQCSSVMLDFADGTLHTAEQALERVRIEYPDNHRNRERYKELGGTVDGEKIAISPMMRLMDRLTINTILYLSQENPSIRRASNNKSVGKKELVEAPKHTKVRVSRNKAPKTRRHVYLLGSDEGRVRVAYKTLVRGHWRQQPYGKGRLLRRTIWIKPHERNKDAPGEAAAHVYTHASKEKQA